MMARQKPIMGGIEMTADQAAERQAAFACRKQVLPDTIIAVMEILRAVDNVHKMTPEQIGRLQGKAIFALIRVEVDLNLFN